MCIDCVSALVVGVHFLEGAHHFAELFFSWDGEDLQTSPCELSLDVGVFIFDVLNLKAAHQSLIDAHHGARVVKLTAVVRCAEEGHELATLEEFVAILNDLMGTAD